MGKYDEDKDKSIVGSLVLYATMSSELTKQSTGTSIIKFRDKAKVKPETNNGIEINADEIIKALKVIRNLEFDLTTSGLSSIGITSVLDAIKDENTGEATRQSICDSNIFNITLISKIIEADQISVPGKYKDEAGKINLEDADWYPVDNWEDISENAWQNCELNRILLSVCEINISDNNNDGVVDMPSTQELLVSLNNPSETTNGSSKLDVIYQSDLLSQTVHNKVKEQEDKGLEIRREAYDNETGLFKKEEVKYLSLFIVESGINLDDSETIFNAESIFDNLLVGENPTPTELAKSRLLRMYICSSNILNYTIVNKIGGGNIETSLLAFPKAYLEGNVVDNAQWYPVNNWEDISENAWEDCELNRLLIGISELGISATGNKIIFSIEEKLDTLLDQSKIEPKDLTTNEDNSKLDVIYHSDIMAMTISKRLNETGNGITIPEFKHTNKENPNEVKRIHITKEGRISLDDEVIAEDEVEKLLTAIRKGLNFNFFSSDPNKKFEYSKILESVSITELNSKPEDSEKTRLELILDSTILHYIISENLINQKQTVTENNNGTSETKSYAIVTKDYYTEYISNDDYRMIEVVDDHNYVAADEIIKAIGALSGFGIDSIESISTLDINDLKEKFAPGDNETPEIVENRATLIKQVSDSAILSKIFGQILISHGIFDAINKSIEIFKPNEEVYHLVKVEEAKDNKEVDIITQVDLSDILSTYGAMFNM